MRISNPHGGGRVVFQQRGRALHVTLALPMTKGCDRLLGFSLQPHDGPYNGLRNFRKTIGFLLLLPLSKRFRSRPLGGLTLYLFYQSSLLLNKSHSLGNIHLCIKEDGCLE